MNKSKSSGKSSLQPAPKDSVDSNPTQHDRLYAINNFDLIRLIAAFQVSFHHLADQLNIERSGIIISTIYKVTNFFPGVPVFFFVSGFLISKSYENSSHLLSYIKNRVLRIYPALFLCVTLSVISVIISGYYNTIDLPIAKFVFWLFSQISMPGFYNPDFMRGYGSGVLDGPVWTISVELQLYILVPIIYNLVVRLNKDLNKSIVTLIIIFFVVNIIYSIARNDEMIKKEIFFKLFNISFLPWLYMFLLGVFFQRNFSWIYKYLNGKAVYALGIYALIIYFLTEWYHVNVGGAVNPVIELLLATLVFSFAYSYKNLSNRLLNHNDISYGVYLYHMPVCNYFIYYGWQHNKIYLIIAILLACIISFISWVSLEKPALLLKKYSINPINWRYRVTSG